MIEPGRVIEFIEGNKFITALVTRVKGNKVLVLGENDREMNISVNRVLADNSRNLNPTSPRNDLVKTLREISARRAELSTQMDIRELWELLEDEGEEFDYEYLAELAFSDQSGGDHIAAVLRAVFFDGLYFKMKPGQAQRHDAEKVEQITLTRAREEEKTKELEEGGDWLARVWKDDLSDEPECRDRVVKILKDMTWFGTDAQEYKWGRKLLEQAGLGADPWRPFYLLCKLGEMGRHENLDLVRYDVPTRFSDEVMAEAEALAKTSAWDTPDRRDLTALEVITADSSGARDFDDAISLKVDGDQWQLGVHIADVSAAVLPGTALDRTARQRATSIYFPDSRVPMLPEILSEECLSLKQDEIRPAFSLLIDLNERGEVKGYEFTPSMLKVRRQLSYQEVDASVETDLLLGRLFKLSLELQARRVENGAMILPLPKLNVFLTPEGEIGVNLTHWENPGRSMIGEFMILANHLAAVFLKNKEVPGLYRCQNEPTDRVVPGDSDCADLFRCLLQRKFLSRVTWGLDPAPHHGMGLSVYTNLTSPLRRYIDLMIQRQVRSVLTGGEPMYVAEDVTEIMTELNVALRQAARVQNNRRRYWLLRYLETESRDEYEALVLEKLPHRWRIFLVDLMLDADLPGKQPRPLTPGETISVRVKKVDAREDILKFELLG